jgi:hypothetical protein
VLSHFDLGSAVYHAVSEAIANGTLVKGVAGIDRNAGRPVVLRVK